MQERMRPLKVELSTSVRMDIEDRDALEEIKLITGVPICKLIHIAIPLLRRKYRIKSEDKGE